MQDLKTNNIKENWQLWLRGYQNLFERELRSRWWGRKFIFGVILWTILINGPLFLSLATGGDLSQEINDPNFIAIFTGDRAAITIFTIWTSLPMFGAIFTMQGVISDDRKLGTLSWILSKPVFRAAVYLAKLSLHAFMGFTVIILLQGLLAIAQVLIEGGKINLIGWLIGTGAVTLTFWFYLALTFLLDMIVNRASAIAIPFGVLIGGAILPQFLLFLQKPQIVKVLLTIFPWGLNSNKIIQIAQTSLQRNQELPPWEATPIGITALCTALWIIVFIVGGLGLFNRQEI